MVTHLEVWVLESGCFLMEQVLSGGREYLVIGSIIQGFIKLSDCIVKVIPRLHWEPTAVEYLTVVEC